ncbi:DUF3781 domain-containing protein [Klebsiella oxytoca]|uniref:DUF3781 domain-containing protein n=1 Tax=Klebsiella oxytoca TaxID=571 RepID=UPI002594D62F|nr:DUF3781 domain-containing protein [Klebsiella oxytoca]MDM4095306.1 DUF3781 domain-containing protein [Klebsiella oxytoca]
MNSNNKLIENLNKLHTTVLGAERIKRNLSLDTTDVLYWCKEKVGLPHAVITRNGKNWYVSVEDCVITVNTHSYTVITAHKKTRFRNKTLL